MEKKIIIAGHRGNRKAYPENTLKAFQSAIDIGCDMIETDIHLTSDGELVLIHDINVERTTDGTGLVKDMALCRIRQLNAGTDTEFMYVPTFREFLELVSKCDICLNLELKTYVKDYGEEKVAFTVDKTVELCEEYGIPDDRIIINSFDAFVLEYTHKKYGRRFALHGFYPYDILFNKTVDPTEYLDYACYWKHPDSKEYCKFLISHGIIPCTGCNTQEEEFFEAVNQGCTMFTENDPLSLLEWRKKL